MLHIPVTQSLSRKPLENKSCIKKTHPKKGGNASKGHVKTHYKEWPNQDSLIILVKKQQQRTLHFPRDVTIEKCINARIFLVGKFFQSCMWVIVTSLFGPVPTLYQRAVHFALT